MTKRTPLDQFKFDAKFLARKAKISHSEGLERLARKQGYSDWHQARIELKKQETPEQPLEETENG